MCSNFSAFFQDAYRIIHLILQAQLLHLDGSRQASRSGGKMDGGGRRGRGKSGCRIFSKKKKKNDFKDCGHSTTYMILPGVSAHAQEKERLNGQRERERGGGGREAPGFRFAHPAPTITTSYGMASLSAFRISE